MKFVPLLAATAVALITTAFAMGGPRGVPACAQTAPIKKPMNILFIAVDDLRPSFGVYGGPIKTPNLDKLARRGTTFLKAYCQQAVCSPSRTSLLTGQRPDTTQIYDLVTHFRKNLPDVVTLPQYFKQNGYHTQSMGKIYHPGLNDEPSWSVAHFQAKNPMYGPVGMEVRNRNLAQAAKEGRVTPPGAAGPSGPPYEAVDNIADNYLLDGATADKAIETLAEVKNKPFFLAVGFSKPHLPFVAPKKYWDLYKPSEIRLPANYHSVPTDGVPIALTGWGELRAYDGMPKTGPVTDEQAKKLIHGYYASASYMDAQVGRVLDALDKQGLAKNTVIVLWGDHGWSLGEHGMWCKHTNFEDCAHAPLILSVPNQKKVGTKTVALAEFVDVYPTLCEAVGLPIPVGLAGKSLLAVTNDPSAKIKAFAISQYPRGGGKSGNAYVMGYSLTDGRYRYTEWGTYGVELYDHQNDPDENANVARLPENKARVETLARALHTAYPGAAKQAETANQAAPTNAKEKL